MSHREVFQTLDEICLERVQKIVNAEVEITDEDWVESVALEEVLRLGGSLTPKQLAWVNQAIEKYELE